MKIPEKFSFAVIGHLEQSDKGLHIITNKGDKLRIFPVPKNFSKNRQIWHLLPTINSTGTISNVQALASNSPQLEQLHTDKCVLVGKVLQVSKRACVVLFEVNLPEGKLLKITLANPDPRMKAEQVWSVSAKLAANKLEIVEALPITLIESEPQPKAVKATAPVELELASSSAPTKKAIDALVEQTGVVE